MNLDLKTLQFLQRLYMVKFHNTISGLNQNEKLFGQYNKNNNINYKLLFKEPFDMRELFYVVVYENL